MDGEPFEGGKSERHSLELGSGHSSQDLKSKWLVWEQATSRISKLPSLKATMQRLAGKPAVFKVKLHEIKRKNLPALDDEFAKDVSEFDTLEEFKEDLASKLADRNKQENESAREAASLKKRLNPQKLKFQMQ